MYPLFPDRIPGRPDCHSEVEPQIRQNFPRGRTTGFRQTDPWKRQQQSLPLEVGKTGFL